MQLLDLTLPTPELNLALDEGLLLEAEDAGAPRETLRLWESPQWMAVLGRASVAREELNLARCAEDGVPVLRRCSGGTAVVGGPGCLFYALVLSYDLHPEIRQVDAAHHFVMSRMQSALAALDHRVRWQGSCDLTFENRKISGNSLRCKRRHLLYHGTILYDFAMTKLARWLGVPPREPDYRAGRSHSRFCTNFPYPVAAIRQTLIDQWEAEPQIADWPEARVHALARDPYATDAWNLRR